MKACSTKDYHALYDAFIAYLQSDFDSLKEKKRMIRKAKELFESVYSPSSPVLVEWDHSMQRHRP